MRGIREKCGYSLTPAGCVPSTEPVADSEQPGILQEPHTRIGLLFHPTLIAPAPVSTQ